MLCTKLAGATSKDLVKLFANKKVVTFTLGTFSTIPRCLPRWCSVALLLALWASLTLPPPLPKPLPPLPRPL
eukprot:6474073-Amphidinium_carterae.1